MASNVGIVGRIVSYSLFIGRYIGGKLNVFKKVYCTERMYVRTYIHVHHMMKDVISVQSKQ